MVSKRTAAKKRATVPDAQAASDLDSHWHLARTDEEIAITELEFSLFRTTSAFERWQAECIAAVAHRPFNVLDNALLHVIRLKDRPKNATELGRLLNREDIANIQYSLRKLQKAGLIERQVSDKRKGTTYRVTPRGEELTDRYAEVRAELLIKLIPSIEHWEEQVQVTHRFLDLMRGIYEQAALTLATHRMALDEE
jgi:predicted MarR family transcription regulator